MAINSSNVFTSVSKLFYEEILNLGNKKGIDEFLFPILDSNDSSEAQLERYTVNPEAIVFRQKDTESHIRPYKAGSGTYYTVPRASEKTPISENLRDSIIAGAVSGNFAGQYATLQRQIIGDHTTGAKITRWKMALDVIRTGKFNPIDENGATLVDGEIDFQRAAGNELTYDFSATGANIDIALQQLVTQYRASGGQYANMCVLLGASWLSAFESLPDADTATKRIASVQTGTITLSMTPPEFQNVDGLYVIGQYRVPGIVAPVWLLSFAPAGGFKQKVNSTPVDFMPANEAVVFSTADARYTVQRGVDILDDSGRVQRAVGQLVFDSFSSKDPVCEYLRSQTRLAFLASEINRTARSTGTFAAQAGATTLKAAKKVE